MQQRGDANAGLFSAFPFFGIDDAIKNLWPTFDDPPPTSRRAMQAHNHSISPRHHPYTPAQSSQQQHQQQSRHSHGQQHFVRIIPVRGEDDLPQQSTYTQISPTKQSPISLHRQQQQQQHPVLPLPPKSSSVPTSTLHSDLSLTNEHQKLVDQSRNDQIKLDHQIEQDEAALAVHLRTHGLCVTSKSRQPRDGDCWARTLAFACSSIPNFPALSSLEIRALAVETLAQAVDHYLPFFVTAPPFPTTSDFFLEECQVMARPGAWMSIRSNIGDFLIDAFARRTRIRVRAIHSDGGVTMIGPASETGPTVDVAYVVTPGQEHYHGVEPLPALERQRFEKSLHLKTLGFEDLALNDKLLRRYDDRTEKVAVVLLQLKRLQEMGFTDIPRILDLLDQNKDDLERVIQHLINK
jgi:hypothetical protein